VDGSSLVWCITSNLGLDYGAVVRAASIWGSSKLGNNDMPWSLGGSRISMWWRSSGASAEVRAKSELL
jgi:hypothetical protein